MTTQQVITALGPPQRRTAHALEYTQIGFAVIPSPQGVVQVVMCGDVTGIRGPLVQAFHARTAEGIGMQSRREEVIKAYGEPTSAQKLSGAIESLSYESLGITFTLEGGKVYHLIVRLEGTIEPERSIQVEPAVTRP